MTFGLTRGAGQRPVPDPVQSRPLASRRPSPETHARAARQTRALPRGAASQCGRHLGSRADSLTDPAGDVLRGTD